MEDILIALCAEVGAAKTIDPIAAAKAAGEARGGDELAWRSLLTEVRQTAVGLARQGKLVIYRKGKPADPDDFRGVYRIGLPRSE